MCLKDTVIAFQKAFSTEVYSTIYITQMLGSAFLIAVTFFRNPYFLFHREGAACLIVLCEVTFTQLGRCSY